MVSGLGLVQGSGFRVQGLGCSATVKFLGRVSRFGAVSSMTCWSYMGPKPLQRHLWEEFWFWDLGFRVNSGLRFETLNS